MTRAVILAMVGVLITAVGQADRAYGAAGGQTRWGSGPMPQAGVCFFNDAEFRGQYFCVSAGQDLARLPGGTNDTITSFRVIGHVEVTVFRDARFKGPSARFLAEVRDLRRAGWNDQISSLRVANASVTWDQDRLPVWGRRPTPTEGACFYRDIDFRGDYFCVPRGASYPMVPAEFNDQISSIRVISAGGVLIFVDRDFGGSVARVTSNVPNLRRGVWSDRISSIRVY